MAPHSLSLNMASRRDKLSLLERARQARRHDAESSMLDWMNNLGMPGWYGFDGEEFHKESKLDDPIVIECWKHTSQDTTRGLAIAEEEVRYIKERDIPAWLEQALRGDGQPSAGLRLIHKFHDSERTDDPFNQRTFAAINQKLGLPDIFSLYGTSLTGACGKYTSTDSRSVIFACKRPLARCTSTTVVRHDFETATTLGYVLSDKKATIHHVLLGIPEKFRTLTHPLLVPFLIGEQMLEEASFSLVEANTMIVEIEDGTGFNNYVIAESESGSGYQDHFRDYRKLSRDLGEAASMFAYLKSRILAIKAMYEFLCRELNSSRSWIPKDKWQDYVESNRKLVERAEYTASHIEHLLFYSGIESRLQVQQNVVFNLIAQEDNRTNIQLSDEMRQIAIKSKRDGSIMKAIAFLGTLFLPATFVSTLFAMPLFNWSAPTAGEIVTNHFWIYWAVTGPLTVATMAIVGYWILSRAQKNSDDKGSFSDEPRRSKFSSMKEKLAVRRRQPFMTEGSV